MNRRSIIKTICALVVGKRVVKAAPVVKPTSVQFFPKVNAAEWRGYQTVVYQRGVPTGSW